MGNSEDGQLDGFLREAFKGSGSMGESVLGVIERLHGAGSSILLREAGDDAAAGTEGDESPIEEGAPSEEGQPQAGDLLLGFDADPLADRQ